MRTLLSLLSLVLVIGTPLHAQDDAKSRAILDKMIQQAKGYTSFQAAFTSRLQSKQDGLDVKQSGTIKVKGKKFHLVLDDNTIISDGATLWTYSSEMNEVSINDPSEMDQDLDPSTLFTRYESGFKSQFVEEKTENGATVQVLKLFPTDPARRAFHTVILHVDKASSEPRMVKILYKDGNEVTYTLTKFTPNVALDDGLFRFDKAKYPGVEVNDLR